MAFFQKTDGSGVLLLAPGDNIAVATAELPVGTQREVDGKQIVLKARVDVGHKFAIRSIPSGSRIVKYGAPIGVATHDIEAGEYVHTHNMSSDYLPTYTLEDGRQFVKEAK
jgi:predicted RecA/RadA family phage recombinase